MRIGSGYDVHRLVPGRPLILGGVVIPFEKGLKGHSDADVLVHSVCDAVFGAAGLGDIGEHFPDNNSEFKGISSLILLERCCKALQNKGFFIVNCDSTIFAQAPRLMPFKREMERNISSVLKIDVNCVNVKATTTEGLGFAGRGEGIGAHTVVLIHK
ncbi:MAG: 2-C-methyl-D-erythritol 2,4-cyclodiphosphate synthase [Desulfobacteraceae bacterium]